MFEVNVETSFAACHALRGYHGKCENLHGHNYKVQLTVTGHVLDHIGLLCDFKELKQFMFQALDELDHHNLNEIEAFRKLNPSAENIAEYLYHRIERLLSNSTQGRAKVSRVRVWETDLNSATYFQ